MTYSPDRNVKPKMKLGAWLIMYGSDVMESFFSNTNTELIKHGYKVLSGHSEVIKFQGILRLSTRFELSDRKKLQATTSDHNKVIDPSSFGKNMGMVSDRF